MMTALKKFKLLSLFLIYFLISSCQTNEKITDQWIDKNEDENYIARHECSFVQAGDKFIMFGGRESAQRLDVYDYKTNTWSIGGKAPKEFNHFQATFYEGFIWVIGAFKTNSYPIEEPEESIWLYDPLTEKWIKGPDIPEARRRGGAGLLVYDDKFYVLGGNTIGHDGGYVSMFDEYDPAKNTWRVLDDAPRPRDHCHIAVIGSNLYAVGGRLSGGEGGTFGPCIDTVDIFNFSSGKWSSLDVLLPTPRAAPGIIVFNNELYVMGGEGEEGKSAFKVVEAYNPRTNTWSRKADMIYPRHGTQAILSGNGIYIAGGSPVRGGGRQLNMEVYNEDAPEGTALVTSHLSGPDIVHISAGTIEKLVLKNEGGNTGVFIDSILIKGSQNYNLKGNFDMRLIRANEKTELEVSYIIGQKGNNANNDLEDIADLYIHYNGQKSKHIKLVPGD